MKLNGLELTRRDVLKAMSASALGAAANLDGQGATHTRADASWLANCHFGISTHWTAQSKPVGADDWLPFDETVARFSPAGYVDQVAGAGADYVIFTGVHALQMLPAPCAAIDRVLPDRTTKRTASSAS